MSQHCSVQYKVQECESREKSLSAAEREGSVVVIEGWPVMSTLPTQKVFFLSHSSFVVFL